MRKNEVLKRALYAGLRVGTLASIGLMMTPWLVVALPDPTTSANRHLQL